MATGSAVWEGTLKEGKRTMRLGAVLTKKTCPVSIALTGTEIKLNAELVSS